VRYRRGISGPTVDVIRSDATDFVADIVAFGWMTGFTAT
jgi:hypothetical protein